MDSNPSPERIHIGAAYYPEHWDERHWANDLDLMKKAGLTVVRMAEFAWSTLEPSAGVSSELEFPPGVEVRKRVGEQGKEVFIIINHEQTEKRLSLPWLSHEYLEGINTRELQLKSYGVAVVTRVEKDGKQ